MQKSLASLARRITNMLSRGAVTMADAAGKMQTLQVSLLADESKDAVEHFEPFGFTSCPKSGAEVLAAFIDGDRSHGVVIAVADRRYRVKSLKAGEVAIYDATGAIIKLTETGIQIDGGGHDINITNAAQVIVTDGDVIADGISLKTHVHGGVQSGSSQTGAPA